MGRLDQYAKEIFSTETAHVTRGAAAWLPPSEINLTEVRLDGRFVVHDPVALAALPSPWRDFAGHDEVIFEAKMQRDHIDLRASERACLRRQARQVQRMEASPDDPWDGDLPLCVLSSHVPAILAKRRGMTQLAEGTYRIEAGWFLYVWVAANELPLRDELVPFLIARSGQKLDELARWLRGRRPSDWLERMLKFLPVSSAVYNDLIRFVLTEPEDAFMAQRQKETVRIFLDMVPEVEAEIAARGKLEGKLEGKLAEARSALRRVLARRKLALAAESEARIDACMDPATLERWLDRAVDAATAAEALQ